MAQNVTPTTLTQFIDPDDIIRLVMQFCAENNLSRTVASLQEETDVKLNTVESLENFSADILNGNWDAVLKSITNFNLPAERLELLYDQIIVELLEAGEYDVAGKMLTETGPMQLVKHKDKLRFEQLEKMANKEMYDSYLAYPSATMNKQKRRQAISTTLATQIKVVQPSRLLSLINSSLKWQQYEGSLPSSARYDLFRGSAPEQKDLTEHYPTELGRTLKFGTENKPLVCAFSPNADYFVAGTSGGFVEMWDADTGLLRKDLRYQEQDNFMMHDTDVVCATFSKEGEMLATGFKDGMLKIWKPSSGQCLRRIPAAHSQSITCVQFPPKDSSQILTGSLDNTLKIHGLRSGKALKEFRGHESFVHDCKFSADGTRVISGSDDGSVKVWDVKSMDLLSSFIPPSTNPTQSTPVFSVLTLPKMPDWIVVCPNAPTVYIMNFTGKIVKTLNSGKRKDGEFVAACASPKGDWVYCVGRDGILYCFSVSDGKLENTLALESPAITSVAHHPYRNMLATAGSDGCIKTWLSRM